MTPPIADKHDAQPEADARTGSSRHDDQADLRSAQDAYSSGSASLTPPQTTTGGYPDTESSAPPSDPMPSNRWWLGVLVGAVVALPIGWLLSYAATLPFLIGPFFFALFGLVIGAVIHRVASPGRPYGSAALLIGTTMVVILVFGETIILESRDFPAEMANQAASSTRTLRDRSIEEFRTQTTQGVRRYLTDNFPPGGTIGYVRWVLTQGEIAHGEIEGVATTLTPLQSGFLWSVRVVLSIALLAFGIGSQTLGLRLRTELNKE